MAKFPVVERAHHAKEHTPWMYLTDLQKEDLLQQMAVTIRRLRTQVNNSTQSHRVLSSRIQDYKRIMMLIASNDIALRLNQILSTTLHHGSGATVIVAQIQKAIDGLHPGMDLHNATSMSFLCQAIGGRQLLFSLSQSHGLPSETTLRRTQTVPRLLPSVGVPTADEINP